MFLILHVQLLFVKTQKLLDATDMKVKVHSKYRKYMRDGPRLSGRAAEGGASLKAAVCVVGFDVM